ncbi:hypothetical protein [Nesterenkonia pannonica]|uniref:hypothetical protein n=1 Tax=Nesterenkonia pannonica TaxID=1548602 RepID=UPI0021648678|nr:hypothetical protein [Nesterenkonia pannonica]
MTDPTPEARLLSKQEYQVRTDQPWPKSQNWLRGDPGRAWWLPLVAAFGMSMSLPNAFTNAVLGSSSDGASYWVALLALAASAVILPLGIVQATAVRAFDAQYREYCRTGLLPAPTG